MYGVRGDDKLSGAGDPPWSAQMGRGGYPLDGCVEC